MINVLYLCLVKFSECMTTKWFAFYSHMIVTDSISFCYRHIIYDMTNFISSREKLHCSAQYILYIYIYYILNYNYYIYYIIYIIYILHIHIRNLIVRYVLIS